MQSMEDDISLYLAMVRPKLEYVPSWVQQFKEEKDQRRATRTISDLENVA